MATKRAAFSSQPGETHGGKGDTAGQTPDMPNQLPSALVFDFDGLILDTESSAYLSTAEVFAEHGVHLDLAEWQKVIGTFDHPHWTELLANRLGEPVDRATWIPLRDRRKLELLEPETVRPGVQELLEIATTNGVGLAVASSSPVEWVMPHLERLELAAYFGAILTRTDVDCDPRRTKPAPDIYVLALDALGVDPTHSIAIEDSPNGVIAAKAAGLWCVAVPGPITRGLDFTAADMVVDSLVAVELDSLLVNVGMKVAT